MFSWLKCYTRRSDYCPLRLQCTAMAVHLIWQIILLHPGWPRIPLDPLVTSYLLCTIQLLLCIKCKYEASNLSCISRRANCYKHHCTVMTLCRMKVLTIPVALWSLCIHIIHCYSISLCYLHSQTLHNQTEALENLFWMHSVPLHYLPILIPTITLISLWSLLILSGSAPMVVPVVAGKTLVNLWGSATDTEGRKAFVFGIKTQNKIAVCALLLDISCSFTQGPKDTRKYGAQGSGLRTCLINQWVGVEWLKISLTGSLG